MSDAWDNSGDPVEFDHDGGEYQVNGTVSRDGHDIKILHIWELVEKTPYSISWSRDPEPSKMLIVAAREALERAWWDQLDWREKRKIKNREG